VQPLLIPLAMRHVQTSVVKKSAPPIPQGESAPLCIGEPEPTPAESLT